jgi:hypothetical protein
VAGLHDGFSVVTFLTSKTPHRLSEVVDYQQDQTKAVCSFKTTYIVLSAENIALAEIAALLSRFHDSRKHSA